MTRTAPTRGRLLRRLTTAVASLAVALGGLALTAPAATAATCAGGFTCEGQSYGYRVTGSGVEYASPRGTFIVRNGAFRTTHGNEGGGRSASLGYPTANEVRQAGGYWYQTFERGVIYVSPRGAYAVSSQRSGPGLWVYDYWESPAPSFAQAHALTGGGGGRLGYPTAPRVHQGGSYAYQTFGRGVLYCGAVDRITLRRGCVPVVGGFVAAHAGQGGGTGWLGYPVESEGMWGDCDDPRGTRWWYQNYERGSIEIYPGEAPRFSPVEAVYGC